MLGAPLLLSLGTLSLRLDGSILDRLGAIACGSGPRQTRLLASEGVARPRPSSYWEDDVPSQPARQGCEPRRLDLRAGLALRLFPGVAF